jgi:hypothetical protein
MIINVGGDSSVLSTIRDREENLINKGYIRIFGLRDMYSENYTSISSVIDPEINELIISKHREIILGLDNSDKIEIFFAIMEFEAWILSMYTLFSKSNKRLSPEEISSVLGTDITAINPETEFFHPTDQVDAIFQSIGTRYRKSDDQIEALFSRLESSDIEVGLERERCTSLNLYISSIESLIELIDAN